eukprot:g11569.t1
MPPLLAELGDRVVLHRSEICTARYHAGQGSSSQATQNREKQRPRGRGFAARRDLPYVPLGNVDLLETVANGGAGTAIAASGATVAASSSSGGGGVNLNLNLNVSNHSAASGSEVPLRGGGGVDTHAGRAGKTLRWNTTKRPGRVQAALPGPQAVMGVGTSVTTANAIIDSVQRAIHRKRLAAKRQPNALLCFLKESYARVRYVRSRPIGHGVEAGMEPDARGDNSEKQGGVAGKVGAGQMKEGEVVLASVGDRDTTDSQEETFVFGLPYVSFTSRSQVRTLPLRLRQAGSATSDEQVVGTSSASGSGGDMLKGGAALSASRMDHPQDLREGGNTAAWQKRLRRRLEKAERDAAKELQNNTNKELRTVFDKKLGHERQLDVHICHGGNDEPVGGFTAAGASGNTGLGSSAAAGAGVEKASTLNRFGPPGEGSHRAASDLHDSPSAHFYSHLWGNRVARLNEVPPSLCPTARLFAKLAPPDEQDSSCIRQTVVPAHAEEAAYFVLEYFRVLLERGQAMEWKTYDSMVAQLREEELAEGVLGEGCSGSRDDAAVGGAGRGGNANGLRSILERIRASLER